MAFRSRGPNVSRLARRGKVEDVRAALRYDGASGDGAAVDPAVAVRVEAAQALAQFDGATVAGDLAAALADPAADVRLAAVGSLGSVGVHDATQVEYLIAAVIARGDRAPELAASALKLIVASVPQQGAELLADRLLDPAAPPLDEGHRASLDLLIQTDDRGAAARDAVVEMLIARLQERPGEEVEARAERVLGWLGGVARERVLYAIENGTAAPALMRAAGRLGDARAVEAVVRGLEDPDAEMREAAAQAARALNHTRAVPALLTATQDDEQVVRDAASAALDRMGTAAVIAGLAAVVDARALLDTGGEGEALGARVAEALEEGRPEGEEPEAQPAAETTPAGATPAEGAAPAQTPTPSRGYATPEAPTRQSPQPVPPPHRPPRRGGLVERLFGQREY